MMTDPVADMLTRINNAIGAHHDRVDIPRSKLKTRIAQILCDEGFVKEFTVQEGAPGTITIFLKYGRERASAIAGLRRKSRPGRRVYVSHRELPKVRNGLGVAILSTSSGVITGAEADRRHVGGEFLCEVW